MADYKMYAFFTAEGEGKAGLTVTITVYNSAGTEMVASGSATGIAGGLYRYTYSNATADDYIGIFKTTDTTVDAKHVPAMVSKQQPMIGDPVALTSAYDAAKTAATQTSVNAIPTTPLLAANYTAPNNTGIGDLVSRLTATRAGYLDKLNVAGTLANTNNASSFMANVSGLMTAAGYTAPDNSGVAAIKAKTDNLPSSPAAVGSAMTLANNAITDAKIATDAISAAKVKADAVTKIQNGLATTTNLAAVKTETAAIKAKTDTIPTNPAKVGDAMTLTSAYDAAKTAASQSSVNAIPTTPLLAANYTAPDNAGITAIKNKTDNLPVQPAAKGDIPTVVNIQSGLAKTSELTPLAKTTDLAGVAKTTDLSGLATETNATSNKTDILDAIDDIDCGGGGSTPAEIWSHPTRTLTASPTDISGLATEANATTNKNTIVTAITNKPVTPATDISGLATEVNATTNKNTIVTAINNKPVTPVTDTSALAKSSELTPLAKSSELTSLAKTSDLTGLAEKTDIPVDYAKELTLQDVKGQTDQLTFTVPGSVDATAVVDTSVLATSAELELVADNVNEIKGKTDQLVFTVPGKVDTDAKIDVSELIDSLLEANIEGSLDLKSTLRIVLAFASGVSEGGGSTTIKYKDLTGLADRIVWTINKSGDRLTSNIDGSDI